MFNKKQALRQIKEFTSIDLKSQTKITDLETKILLKDFVIARMLNENSYNQLGLHLAYFNLHKNNGIYSIKNKNSKFYKPYKERIKCQS